MPRWKPACEFVAVCSMALIWQLGVAAGGEVVPLQQKLDKQRTELHAPGALVGVYRPGLPDVVLTLGMADVEAQRLMSADCHFRIGSISKAFVGNMVLILAGEGKLSLDDPIAKYVPNVPNGDSITLRHLANHRSGIFNPIESREVKDLFAAEPEKSWTTDQLLGFCTSKPTYFAPGEQRHYSNGNTVLLAIVAEKVEGKPWQESLRERVLVPLDLRHTSVPSDNSLPLPFAEGYARGTEAGPFFHRGDRLIRVTNTSPTWWGPAGSMISTLGDLRKAAKPLATGALLTPAMREELHRWTGADKDGFDYGFHIERVKGAIGHDGDVPGYQCCMYYLPGHDATLVAMTNLYGWSVRNMPADRLAWAAAKSLGLTAE